MKALTDNVVPYIPESAPFSPAQRGWLNGYLAGLCSRDGIESPFVSPESGATGKNEKFLILYGSQTGNAESAAKQLAKKLKKSRPDIQLMSLDEFDPSQVPEPVTLAILTSTYGDGEPPDNAATFVSRLTSDEDYSAHNIKFSVFGFGDSNYPDFNACARTIDEWFVKRGSTRIHPPVFADVDFESGLESWQSEIINLVLSSGQPAAGFGSAVVTDTGGETSEDTQVFSRKNPFMAKVLENYNLNNPLSSKQTHHLSLGIDPDRLPYQPGDALGVIPGNASHEVQNILEMSRLDGAESVQTPDGREMTLEQALTGYFDIHNLRKECVTALAKLDRNGPWNDRLAAYNNLRLSELLELTKVIIPTGNYLTSLLKPIQPRLYSISSSPLAHNGEVHVTAGVVIYQYEDFHRKGLCSNYLKELEAGKSVNVYIHENKIFKLPADQSRDIIMIGPGTGIAPFRGFLHHRMHSGSPGRNWLFFGDQRLDHDFLYQTELNGFLESGFLTRLDTAFSRDQHEKIYVQNRMRENAAELIDWLESGACLYVCGDAKRMAKDVESALIDIVAAVLAKSPDQALEYINTLKQQNRYLRDVY